MDNFYRLAKKVESVGCNLLVRFDPDEDGEEWGIKFYPNANDDAHYYAYNSSLDDAARQLLDEIRGFIR